CKVDATPTKSVQLRPRDEVARPSCCTGIPEDRHAAAARRALYNGAMSSASPHSGPAAAGQARFATTSWSVVAAAQDPASPLARDALASLCDSYWYPLYAYIRRQGHSADQAEDLTQEFFTRLLEQA